MKFKEVKPKDLKEYRIPTEDEKRKIYRYMQPELESQKRQIRFFKTVMACFAVFMTAGMLYSAAIKTAEAGALVVGVVITGIFWFSFVELSKSFLKNKLLTICIQDGNYQVLDCMSYKHYYNQDTGIKEGSVKIQTKEETVCCINYVIDIETALQCEKEDKLPLLLMYEPKTGVSRVFSEKMLNGR